MDLGSVTELFGTASAGNGGASGSSETIVDTVANTVGDLVAAALKTVLLSLS